jgi:Domain of unknown function (DUF4173)
MSDASISTPNTPNIMSDDSRLPRRFAVVAGFAGFADWLFYGHKLGIAVVLFVVVLEIAVLLSNPRVTNRRVILAATGVLFVALLPLIESVNIVSLFIAAAGATYFALTVTPSAAERLSEKLTTVSWFLVAGPFQIIPDVRRDYKKLLQGGQVRFAANALTSWIIPMVLGGVFLALFASANPLIENWFIDINIKDIIARIDLRRVLFWLGIAAVAWPFIRVSRQFIEEAWLLVKPAGIGPIEISAPEQLFGKAAILRSLVLFNLLFAVQTVMDINYLWRGAALPDGMTYATYSHRGAYPLIATALLAAGFVIAAMRPGSATEASRVIRILVFIWTGQNVLLVISAILRLDLYVEMYSLTYWRAAAFIWMFLVVVGLILIVTRIAFNRSNAWLISMNLAALALTIYVCSFVNFAHVIGTFNVAHSREVSGQGVQLDTRYLASLGPRAIGAIDQFIAHRNGNVTPDLLLCRKQLSAAILSDMRNWRSWTFRDWRLKSYLESKTGESGSIL